MDEVIVDQGLFELVEGMLGLISVLFGKQSNVDWQWQ
jgi:hypothetical protein